MLFNAVIGNPPYNDDIYLQFVSKSLDMIADDGVSLMVTPAKWWLKEDDDNRRFRENVVPHMSEIVYFFDSQDVFNIALNGGVAFYTIDKGVHSEKWLTNRCVKADGFSSDRRLVDCSTNLFLQSELCRSICDKVGCFDKDFKAFIPRWEPENKEVNLFVTTVAGISGGRTFSNDGNLLMLSVVNKVRNGQFRTQDFKCIYSADSEEEADYFISWAYTKFIRFMLMPMWHSYHINNNKTWSCVPHPGKFDHVFSDEEFYATYNLNEDEREFIESVIKEK